MFSIKIEFTGGEKVYKFKDDQEVLIGKGDNCQVKLEIDGISRQHMKIYSRSGDYFCQDLGSTNGSFINDDKLEPNTEVAFTSFFPIRLGFDVFVNLQDEVDTSSAIKFPDPVVNKSSSTKSEVETGLKKSASSSASSSSASKSETIDAKRGVRSKRAIEPKTKVMSKSHKNKFIYLLVGGALYFYFVVLKSPPPEEPAVAESTPATAAPAPAAPAPVAAAPVKAFQLSPEEEVLIKNSVAVQKCMTSDEVDLCKNFNFLRQRSFPEGVLSKPNAFIVVFDALKTLDVFKTRYKYTPKEAENVVAYVRQNFGRAADKLQFKMTYSLNAVPEAKIPKVLAVFEYLYLSVNRIDPAKLAGKSLIMIPIISENNNYKVIGYFKPDLEKLRNMPSEELHFNLKMAGITGVFKGFDELFP
jgi:hypothetical protein